MDRRAQRHPRRRRPVPLRTRGLRLLHPAGRPDRRDTRPRPVAVSGYRRTLDLSQGVVTASYIRSGVTYERQIFAGRPDDAIVLHFSQRGGGRYTGSLALAGTHGESTTADSAGRYASFGAAFPNGLRYGAAVTAYSDSGRVAVDGTRSDLHRLPGSDRRGERRHELRARCRGPATGTRPSTPSGSPGRRSSTPRTHSADTLLHTHVADYRDAVRADGRLAGPLLRAAALSGHLGAAAGARDGRRARPRTGGAYLQFGRYLMISGSGTACRSASRACGWTATTRTGWAITTPTSTSR